VKLKATCKVHPNDAVLLLAGTTRYVKNNAGEYCDEDEEKAIGVELDEYNTYCTGKGGQHAIGFKIVTDW
jgi:hypothetical protein